MMVQKFQYLSIILAISVTLGYAKKPGKIIGGTIASIIEIPYQVSLQLSDGEEMEHFCGGTIIGTTLILTAAHCIFSLKIDRKREKIYAVFGTADNEYRTPNNVIRVIKCIHHNTEYSDTNDIAMLLLERPIVFNYYLKPAALPYLDVSRPGTHVMSSGWGATTYNIQTNEGGEPSRYLQKLERIVLSQQECQERMKPHRIGPEHICVWSPNGADSCEGDSGGPLTYRGIIIGITSYGIGCGLNYPDVYTRVHHYLQWIYQVAYYLNFNMALPPNSPEFVEAHL